MNHEQFHFPWIELAASESQPSSSDPAAKQEAPSKSTIENASLNSARLPNVDTPNDSPATLDSQPNPFADLPVPEPLAESVSHGIFGVTEGGSIDPDEEEVRALTQEHAREMMATLADAQAVEDALRTGEDPRTGKVPSAEESRTKLAEFLVREEKRLKNQYSIALAAYAQGFGDEATQALDLWVRKAVADAVVGQSWYDPGHPWHYYHEGDHAPPIPVEAIEGDIEVGRFIEREVPKNPAKRAARLRELLIQERQRVLQDKQRYQEIVERGADALSSYDREIAHTNDEMARATALALKYNHIRYGLGRVAWLEQRLGIGVESSLLSSHEDTTASSMSDPPCDSLVSNVPGDTESTS